LYDPHKMLIKGVQYHNRLKYYILFEKQTYLGFCDTFHQPKFQRLEHSNLGQVYALDLGLYCGAQLLKGA
jgi:hypothetical protein